MWTWFTTFLDFWVKLLISLLWKNMATWEPGCPYKRHNVTVSNHEQKQFQPPNRTPWMNPKKIRCFVRMMHQPEILKKCQSFTHVCIHIQILVLFSLLKMKSHGDLQNWMTSFLMAVDYLCSMHLPDLPGIAMLTLALALAKDLSEQYCVGGKGGDGGSPFGPLDNSDQPSKHLSNLLFSLAKVSKQSSAKRDSCSSQTWYLPPPATATQISFSILFSTVCLGKVKQIEQVFIQMPSKCAKKFGIS